MAYQSLIDEFEVVKLPYIDFDPYLLKNGWRRGEDIHRCFDDTGHYSDAGNMRVAEMVYEELDKRDLLAK